MSSRFFARRRAYRPSPPCSTRSTHPARDGCRTEILPDLRCEPNVRPGGGGDWSLAAPEQILPTCHGVHAGNAEENFSGHLFFPKSMANVLTNRNVRTPAARQKFCRNTRVVRHGTSPRSSRRSLWRHEALGSPHAVMANMRGLLGPFPTAGNGPRRTRRLRVTLSTEHDPVVFQYRAGEPAEILPPDDSGACRVKPSSDGRGGGGQNLVLNLSLRTL